MRRRYPTISEKWDGGSITGIYKNNNASGVTLIMYNYFLYKGNVDMYVDGINVPFQSNYRFGDTKEHKVVLGFSEKQVTTCQMFSNCENMISVDFRLFNTSQVVDMSQMFAFCTSLTSLDLQSFDTSNVMNMNGMFMNCSNMISLDVSSFNTSKVETMETMFMHCESISSIDISSFNVSNVSSMYCMFFNCKSLKYINFPTIFTYSDVSSTERMFGSCGSITSIDLSFLDTSSVLDTSYMFMNCSKLQYIKMMGDVSNNRHVSFMFLNINATGTFKYNSNYDYGDILNVLPSTWTAVPV